MKFIHRFRITRPVTCKNIYLIAHFHIYTRLRVFKIELLFYIRLDMLEDADKKIL